MKLKDHTAFRLLVLAALLLFSTSSKAIFIYDVVVDYQGGYQYEFSMLFEDITEGPLRETDLINGEFADVRFTQNGVAWPLVLNDFNKLNFLIFDPFGGNDGSPSIRFKDERRFAPDAPPQVGSLSTFQLAHNVLLNDFRRCVPTPRADLCFVNPQPFRATGLVVNPRTAQVPAPATLSLLALGVAGLVLMRRRAIPQLEDTNPHGTNAANA